MIDRRLLERLSETWSKFFFSVAKPHQAQALQTAVYWPKNFFFSLGREHDRDQGKEDEAERLARYGVIQCGWYHSSRGPEPAGQGGKGFKNGRVALANQRLLLPLHWSGRMSNHMELPKSSTAAILDRYRPMPISGSTMLKGKPVSQYEVSSLSPYTMKLGSQWLPCRTRFKLEPKYQRVREAGFDIRITVRW